MGGGACGDESVVPQQGMLAGPLKMFIARKPHPTGIKCYCLADATWGYVVDMYLYTGVRGRLRRYGTAAGNFDAKNIMKLWASLLPEGTVLCADSFFGSHGLAKELAANKRPFLMMTKRSTYGVTWAGEHVQEGQTAVCTVADFKYSLCTYKNPKVGHKPPRVVPMLTNVWFARKGPPHQRSGREVHPVVAAYRTLSRGVDGVNQMALQMRQVGRQMTWTHAVRAFVLRYAVVNVFATCRQLGLCKETTRCGNGNGKCCGGGTLPTPYDKKYTCRWRHNGGVCATFARGEEPAMNVPVVERHSTSCALHRDMAMEVCKAHGTWR